MNNYSINGWNYNDGPYYVADSGGGGPMIPTTPTPKEHSKNFEKVKYNYENYFWTIEQVRNAVGRWITEEEFEEITGEKYS